MSAIGKGDWVECVRDDWAPDAQIKAGHLYLVEGSKLAGLCTYCGDGLGPGFLLAGVNTAASGFSWCACTLRPIWRGDKSLIETLLEPVADAIPDQVATEVSRVGA